MPQFQRGNQAIFLALKNIFYGIVLFNIRSINGLL